MREKVRDDTKGQLEPSKADRTGIKKRQKKQIRDKAPMFDLGVGSRADP